MLKYFLGNNLFSPKQSEFRHGDSCINQPLSINHDIITCSKNGLWMRMVLDTSKAFNEVWHNGPTFKLKQNGIKEELLHL